eukprot:8691864-Lingulodinium_polyedra.AAC.1
MARAPPSKVIMEGVPSPKVPKFPVASAGTMISSSAASARRGKSVLRKPRHSAHRRHRQPQLACSA